MGWPVVLAATAGVAMSTLNVYSLGLFIEPFEKTFGWSRAAITAGPLFQAVVTLLLGPFSGAAIDRFGPRRLGVAGVVSVACITLLFSRVGPSIWSWWGVWVLLALINTLLQPSVWTAGVSGFFAAGRGLAFAVTLTGSGISSLVSPPLTYWLIVSFGWRWAYVGLVLFWSAVVVPLVLLFFTSRRDSGRRRSREAGTPPPRPAREGLSDLARPRFLQLAAAAFLIACVVVPFTTSLMPILSWTGLARGRAAAITGSLGLSAIAGRLAIGFLLDRVEGRYLAAASLLAPVASSLLLQFFPGSVPAAAAAVLILGAALGAELDLVAYLTSRYFGLERFGLLFGTIAGLITLAGGLGPWVMSLVYDATHSYGPTLVAFVPMSLLAALLFLLLGPYPTAEAAAGTVERDARDPAPVPASPQLQA